VSVRVPGAAASASLRSPLLWLDVALYLLLPLVGLLWWGWDWRPVVLLYWLENVTVGGVTFIALRRRAAAGGEGPGGFPAPFFLMHYGIFTFVHGVFVIVLILLAPVLTGSEAAPFDALWLVLAWLGAAGGALDSPARAGPPPRPAPPSHASTSQSGSNGAAAEPVMTGARRISTITKTPWTKVKMP